MYIFWKKHIVFSDRPYKYNSIFQLFLTDKSKKQIQSLYPVRIEPLETKNNASIDKYKEFYGTFSAYATFIKSLTGTIERDIFFI